MVTPPIARQALREIAGGFREPAARFHTAARLRAGANVGQGHRRHRHAPRWQDHVVHQLREERQARGVPLSRSPFVSFEDERLAGLDAAHLHALVNEYDRLPTGSADVPVLWCFDEIQVVPGWERFVRRLLDAAGHEVVVTGSSAALLSREIATALRDAPGRC